MANDINREVRALRLLLDMNNRLRLETLAALSRVFREHGVAISDDLFGILTFAIPNEIPGLSTNVPDGVKPITDTPSAQPQPPSSLGVVAPSAAGTQPPSSTGTQPPSSVGTQPPSSFGIQPPSATGTQPPSSVGTQPPSSVGTQPPSSTGDRVDLSKPLGWKQDPGQAAE